MSMPWNLNGPVTLVLVPASSFISKAHMGSKRDKMKGYGWLKVAICHLTPRTMAPFGELVDAWRVLSLLGFPGWSSVSSELKIGAGLENHQRDWCQGPHPRRGLATC